MFMSDILWAQSEFISQIHLFNSYCLKLAFMTSFIMAFSYILWLIFFPFLPPITHLYPCAPK